jgi:hypothetical protein
MTIQVWSNQRPKKCYQQSMDTSTNHSGSPSLLKSRYNPISDSRNASVWTNEPTRTTTSLTRPSKKH